MRHPAESHGSGRIHASEMRRRNGALLLDLIRREGPVSRADLARRSGLTKPTVSSQMAALLRRGVVVEQGPGDSKARGGKRPTLVGFNADCGRLVGVEIGASRVRIELTDLNGAALGRLTLAVHPERGAGRILEIIAKGIAKVLENGPRRKITVVGIAAPGRVDARQGVVLEAGNVFNWQDVAVREHLEKALRLPVVVDNDVNLAALGEMRGGVAVGLRNFVLIRLTTGIGAGVVLEGKLWQGSHWAAGEIGHILLDHAEVNGGGGPRGYLESLVASDRLTERARAASSSLAALIGAQDLPQALKEAVRLEDPAAGEILDNLARHLGMATVQVAAAFDPELIVLQGELFDLVIDRIRRIVERAVPWPVRIESSTLGDDAVLLGAISVARGAANELLARP